MPAVGNPSLSVVFFWPLVHSESFLWRSKEKKTWNTSAVVHLSSLSFPLSSAVLPCTCGTWMVIWWRAKWENPQTFLVLPMADLSACGSNQNYPLIDYLQGSRKALMDLILNPPQIFKVSFWSGLPKNRLFLFYKTAKLSPSVCRNGPAWPRRLLDGIMGRQ